MKKILLLFSLFVLICGDVDARPNRPARDLPKFGEIANVEFVHEYIKRTTGVDIPIARRQSPYQIANMKYLYAPLMLRMEETWRTKIYHRFAYAKKTTTCVGKCATMTMGICAAEKCSVHRDNLAKIFLHIYQKMKHGGIYCHVKVCARTVVGLMKNVWKIA